MEQKRKLTNAQLEKRLNNAVIHIDRDRSYKGIYFDDKGLRLEVLEDCCIVSTGFHRHIFQSYCLGQTISRPYMYIKRFVDIAYDNAGAITITKDNGNTGFSYGKLMSVLKDDEKKNDEFLVAYFCDLYFYTIFSPLYSIGESVTSAFIVYLTYVCDIAKQSIILAEHKESMTNKQFIEKFCDMVKELTAEIDEQVVFEPMTDEQRLQAEIDAIQEQENEQLLLINSDESQN